MSQDFQAKSKHIAGIQGYDSGRSINLSSIFMVFFFLILEKLGENLLYLSLWYPCPETYKLGNVQGYWQRKSNMAVDNKEIRNNNQRL